MVATSTSRSTDQDKHIKQKTDINSGKKGVRAVIVAYFFTTIFAKVHQAQHRQICIDVKNDDHESNETSPIYEYNTPTTTSSAATSDFKHLPQLHDSVKAKHSKVTNHNYNNDPNENFWNKINGTIIFV